MRTFRRRDFLRALAALPGAARLARGAARRAGEGEELVPVLYASAFSAPFIVARLRPGVGLGLRRGRGRTYLTLGDDTLGLLPARAARRCLEAELAGRPAAVSLARVGRNDRGRLELFARLSA